MDLHDTFSATTPAAPEAHPRRRWRHAAAGAFAGGLLAAAVTVPVTIGVARAVSPDAVTAPGTASAPRATQQLVPGDHEYGGYAPVDPYVGQLPGGFSSSTATATDEQSAGVVLVDSTLTDGEAAGTGMVIDAGGLVLTNYHVVEGSTAIEVTIATTGETYGATVVGRDASADVALLQLEEVVDDLTTVTIDDDDPVVGDAVTAIGNAEGQGYLSAATGTVQATDQSITTQPSGSAAGEDLTGLLQTDAAVVGGYSGGALLDAEGEVVGITTAASTGGPGQGSARGSAPTSAESYAVPIDAAMGVVDQIESETESGTTQVGASPYLGVSIGQDLAVAAVEADSPADGAGITAGSTLTALDDTPVATYDALSAVLLGLEPGDRVGVSWTDADGTTQQATITLGSSPVS